MSNLNVAVLGAKDVAGEIGKKGTVTDITFFELKKGNDSVTLLEPSKYPEKMSSIFYTVEMAEFAILVVDKIDSFLGETIVIADCVGIPRGWIVLRNYIQPEQLKPLIAGTCMENYEFKELEPITMRDELLKIAADQNRKPGEGTSGSCPVDRREGLAAVQLCGYARLPYSGAMAVGYRTVAGADGGKIQTAETGRSVLVTDVDESAAVCGVIL